MKKITIIGTGTIGKIFLSACQKVFSDAKITATVNSDESVRKLQQEFSDIEILTDNKKAVEDSDLVILACKPQNFSEVAGEIKDTLKKDTLIVSVMAGINLEKIQLELGLDKIVRTMPNLGARVGKSMTVWTCSNEIDDENKKVVSDLLNSIGKELFVDTEEKVNKATAVSGSGPGFFFAVVEEWLMAVEEFGFSKDEARLLLLQTIDGSNNLLQKGDSVSELREQVTSKGGTTEAGLEVLQKKDLENIFLEVLQAAHERAKELSI